MIPCRAITVTALRLCASVVAGWLLAVSFASVARSADQETNLWPVKVEQRDAAGQVESWTGAGPFLFRQPAADAEGNTASGFRPFWVQFHTPKGEFRAGHFLYPLFSHTVREDTYKWSFFQLVRRWDRRANAPAPATVYDERGEFEIFPFWFSRQSGDPELSYRGLFPLYGTVKNKLGFERLSWTLFPLYTENEKRGAVTTSTPWPFIRVTRGAAHGWGFWPFFHYIDRPGVSRHETYLWPLGYNVTRQPHPDDPPGTAVRRDVGALPFYASSTGPGYVSRDYVWPFIGYTDRTEPKRYRETRYFWPFLVQGEGEDRLVNRWAPFYSHSINKGKDKRWYAWPLVRHARWEDNGIGRTRTQFLYFLYWHEAQRNAGRTTSRTAELTHVWPFFSNWDSGAGHRQWQVFSPFDVFFPRNYQVRHAWTPFVALARHESPRPGDTRTSILWNAITWAEQRTAERSEFHLGPLLGITRDTQGQRVAFGNGLFGFSRESGGRWKPFWSKPTRNVRQPEGETP